MIKIPERGIIDEMASKPSTISKCGQVEYKHIDLALSVVLFYNI